MDDHRRGRSMAPKLRVFLGYDSREPEAYDVAEYSLRRHSSIELDIRPLKQGELRDQQLYWRPVNEPCSTEFTFTRFLVPHLCEFKGYAMFADSDFLWTDDIAEMIHEIAPHDAVSCVKHDYQPTEAKKMDGQRQVVYPRKNWSSMMFFNCAHAACQMLDLQTVNRATPQYLHRLMWAEDEEIGAISEAWNWLEGWCNWPLFGPPPPAIHFTRGGPWFPDYQNVEYAELWRDEYKRMKAHRNADHHA